MHISIKMTSAYTAPLNGDDANMTLLKRQLIKSDSLFHEDYKIMCNLILHLFSELEYNPYHYNQKATTACLKEIHDAFRFFVFVLNDPSTDTGESVDALKKVTEACRNLYKEMKLQIESCELKLQTCKADTLKCDANLRRCIKENNLSADIDETSAPYSRRRTSRSL